MTHSFWIFPVALALAASGGGVSRADEAPPAAPPSKPELPTQSQILDEILKDQAPPPTPAAKGEALRKEAPPAPPVKLAELLRAPEASLGPLENDGTLVIQARAQLVRVGGEQRLPVLVFRSDNKQAPHRPMIVHPNRKLEELEAAQATSGQDVQFTISGVVETYRGNNYILLRRASVLRKDDNLE